jgi:hypothetical protein
MEPKDTSTAEPATPTNTNTSPVNLRNNNEADVIYTPPSSTTSMSSAPTTSTSLTGAANISIRTYIYFLPYPLPPNTPVPYTTNLLTNNPLKLPTTLFEPTSTLVLTSPTNTFVDLRFLKPLTPCPAADELEWGFAGHSSSRPTALPGVSHSTWTHFVDSRYPTDFKSIPVDEGDMYALNDNLTLEHGHAFHPHLKAVKSHEEMWEDEDVLSTDAGSTKKCVVLGLQDDKKGIRGAIVRLGQYVQGIVVMGNGVTAERWEWTEKGGWKRTKRVGRQMLPCAVLMGAMGLSVGGVVRFGEFEWSVQEVWEW